MIKHRAQDKNERGLSVMEKLKLDFYYGREAEQFTFYRLPKALITDACFKGMTNNAKLLYGLMLDRKSLSKKRGWLDEANKVFIKYSLNNIEEDLNVSRKTASSLLKELEEIGLIDMIQQPGVANIIYVKNFVSERDELTQIKNRRGFMEQAMKMNRIYKNRKAIILFADMDGLKQINDNYGHAAGDIAICACADILKKAAGVHGIAGRLGGDEFALMMIGDETRAIELMETVQKEIAMYNAQGKNKFAFDMSVGCQLVLCTDELSIPMVLEKADKIMYEEKKKKGKAR